MFSIQLQQRRLNESIIHCTLGFVIKKSAKTEKLPLKLSAGMFHFISSHIITRSGARSEIPKVFTFLNDSYYMKGRKTFF